MPSCYFKHLRRDRCFSLRFFILSKLLCQLRSTAKEITVDRLGHLSVFFPTDQVVAIVSPCEKLALIHIDLFECHRVVLACHDLAKLPVVKHLLRLGLVDHLLIPKAQFSILVIAERP